MAAIPSFPSHHVEPSFQSGGGKCQSVGMRPDYTKGYTAHTAASARKGRGHSSNLQACTSSDLFTDDVDPQLESAREKVRAFYVSRHASPLREVSSSLLFVFLRCVYFLIL